MEDGDMAGLPSRLLRVPEPIAPPPPAVKKKDGVS